jgi:hypothetical protein
MAATTMEAVGVEAVGVEAVAMEEVGLLLAQRGHHPCEEECPLSRVEQPSEVPSGAAFLTQGFYWGVVGLPPTCHS